MIRLRVRATSPPTRPYAPSRLLSFPLHAVWRLRPKQPKLAEVVAAVVAAVAAAVAAAARHQLRRLRRVHLAARQRTLEVTPPI